MSRDWLQGLRGKICWYINPVSLLLYCHLLCFPSDATFSICLAVPSVTPPPPRCLRCFPKCGLSSGQWPGHVPRCRKPFWEILCRDGHKNVSKESTLLAFEIMPYMNIAEKLLLFLSVVLPLLLNDLLHLPSGHVWKWHCKLFLLYALWNA